MATIAYTPIGVVKSPVTEPLRPEAMRGAESRLVLHSRFARAAAGLQVGQYLLVFYHLHRAKPRQDDFPSDVFIRRGADRPNPIGLTLTQIVALEQATITVIGLDAIDGSPILDLKLYKPIFDAPPVMPRERAT